MDQNGDLRKAHRLSSIIAGAMMSGLLLYLGIVEVFKLQHKPFGGFSPQAVTGLKDIFLLGALGILVLIRKARSTILKKERTDDLKKLIARLNLATLVTFALCETPAILGMVLFLLGGLDKEFYILLTCSMVVMFVYFPRYRHWEAFVGNTSSFY